MVSGYFPHIDETYRIHPCYVYEHEYGGEGLVEVLCNIKVNPRV